MLPIHLGRSQNKMKSYRDDKNNNDDDITINTGNETQRLLQQRHSRDHGYVFRSGLVHTSGNSVVPGHGHVCDTYHHHWLLLRQRGACTLAQHEDFPATHQPIKQCRVRFPFIPPFYVHTTISSHNSLGCYIIILTYRS